MKVCFFFSVCLFISFCHKKHFRDPGFSFYALSRAEACKRHMIFSIASCRLQSQVIRYNRKWDRCGAIRLFVVSWGRDKGYRMIPHAK